MSDSDVLKMKVADLKRELKLRGLSTTGNKTELQERLQTALIDGDLALEDSAISEELLDEVLTDEEDKTALDLSNEDAVLQTPDKEEEKILEEPPSLNQNKKVILKRKNSITVSQVAPDINITSAIKLDSNIPPEKMSKIDAPGSDKELDLLGADNKDSNDKKVVKLSQLSLQDRLEMRAKKFGLPVSGDALKDARAKRFGSGESKAGGESIAANGATVQTSIDVLKKRAERFGCSVSSRMTELEKREKLLKRQERFGSSTNGSSATTPADGTTTTTVDYNEKAKQRLERFKTAVK